MNAASLKSYEAFMGLKCALASSSASYAGVNRKAFALSRANDKNGKLLKMQCAHLGRLL